MINQCEGYDYQRDANGAPIAVERSTGEVKQAVDVTIPVGSIIYTPEDQERYKRWKAEQERKQQEAEDKKKRRKTATELGTHYFVNGSQFFDDLAPATVTRLIFLSTFCGYSEQGNKLMLTSKTQMHKNDLSEILKVSKSTAERFLREVSPRYVKESNGGYLFLNSDIFVKGILDRGSSYYRFYADWVRQLYHATEMKKHKLLGYLFQMIPFVNREYNLLCHNPQERDFDLVEVLTLDEFIEKIGYDKSDRHRLIKIYKNLVFPVGDHMERFCSVVSNGVVQDNGKSKLYINPNVLYSGSRYKEVRILGKFCKD